MEHHIIAIANGQLPKAIKPNDQELQALIDTEDFLLIDSLQNRMVVPGGDDWEPITTGRVCQDGGIVEVR